MKLVYAGIAVLVVGVFLYGISSGMSYSYDINKYNAKISRELLERVGNENPGELVPVIIELKGFYSNRLGLFGIEKASAQKEVASLIKRFDGKIKHRYHLIPSIAAKIPASKVYELVKHPLVKRISLDRKVRIFLQDSVPLVRANYTWDVQINGMNITGKDVTVCLIDTGVDYNHPDLGGGWGNKVLDGYDFVNNDTNPMDDNGHGTHCAGIIAANGSIKGVAPDAKLVAIKAMDSTGYGDFSDLDSGLEWCINHSEEYNISVISMSLGTENYHWYDYCDSDFSSTASLIDQAVENGIAVVIASGNENNYSAISAPACIKNATAVTASDKSDNMAGYANRNSITDLDAPGTYINSTYLGGGYAQMYGTSMATPHVAGAFALFVQAYRLMNNATPEVSFVEEKFKETGKNIHDSASGLNFSRIDVYAAVGVFFPDILVESPLNQQTYFNGSIHFNITVDKNLTSAWFSVDGGENADMVNDRNYHYCNTTYPPLAEGFHNVTFFANSSGAINSTSVWFSVDLNPPDIVLLSPENNSVWNETRRPEFIFKAIDRIENVMRCFLWINDSYLAGENLSVQNNTETLIISNISLEDGNYTWWVNCSDGVWSNTSENRSFSVNASLVECESCQECESKISDAYPGDTVLVNRTLEVNGTCLVMNGKENITIDCSGNQILGNSSGYGLYLNRTQRVKIRNCSIGNFSYGVYLDRDVNGFFQNLSLFSNGMGIWLEAENQSECNKSFQNVSVKGAELIYRNSTQNLSVKDMEAGEVVFCGVNESVIQNITIEDGDGIFLILAWNNTVNDSRVRGSGYGIYIRGSGNLIYNNFFSNQVNVWVNGTNFWNTSLNCSVKNIINGSCLGGNYWNDYNGIDEDNDTIGETPYVIDSQNSDYLPLKNMPPQIRVLSPENRSYNYTNLTLKYYVWDSDNVTWVWYDYNQTNHTLWNGSNETVEGNITFQAPENQASVLWVWANDSEGWVNASRVVFTVDTVTPKIENINVQKSYTSAVVSWDTNEPADSRTEYGESQNLGSEILNSSLVWNHSVTITGLSSGKTYYYNITSCDEAGNCNESGVFSFTTSSSESGGTSEGSSGGGERGSNITSCSKIWNKIVSGTEAVMNITREDIGIREIVIKVKKDVRYPKLTVSKLSDIPTKTPLPEGIPYQYLQINNIGLNEDVLEEVNITFRVEKTWINENNLTRDSIKLFRFLDEKWEWKALETWHEREDNTYVYYAAKSPGFSYFVITGINETKEKICENGEKRCYGKEIQECNGTGWVTIKKCEYKCNETTLSCENRSLIVSGTGVCKSGETKCEGKSIMECIEGEWKVKKVCEYGCLNGSCVSKPETEDLSWAFVLGLVAVLGVLVYFGFVRK